MRLNNAILHLSEIKILMRSFPNVKTYRKHGITRDTWIKYHYVSFISTVVGLEDISLILANYTFRLGIPEPRCSLELIIKNAWVGTSVRSALKKLARTIDPLREPRNLRHHRGEWPYLEEIDELEFYTGLSKMSDGVEFIPRRLMTLAYAEATREIIAQMETKEYECTTAVNALLDSLLPIYQRTKLKL